jgi:2-methylisocitrate lyase-like PEP mutase family enzyme
MNDTQHKKGERFLARHRESGCFLMPNAWDPGSAKMLVASGFDAIGTTSAGIAFSRGKPDNVFCAPDARVERDTMLAEVRAICQSVSIPVNADLEAGFGNSPEDVAETLKLAIQSGAVGANIEDYTGIKDHPLYDRSLAVERIKAARRAIDESGIPFVLVARTDRFNIGIPGDLSEAIERANLYREAGADCLFAPGASDVDTVRELVRELAGPLNVVMGLSGCDVSFAQLRDLGVRRVSVGGSLARSLYFRLREAAQEMLEHGTFSYANEQIPQSELNQLFERKF